MVVRDDHILNHQQCNCCLRRYRPIQLKDAFKSNLFLSILLHVMQKKTKNITPTYTMSIGVHSIAGRVDGVKSAVVGHHITVTQAYMGMKVQIMQPTTVQNIVVRQHNRHAIEQLLLVDHHWHGRISCERKTIHCNHKEICYYQQMNEWRPVTQHWIHCMWV